MMSMTLTTHASVRRLAVGAAAVLAAASFAGCSGGGGGGGLRGEGGNGGADSSTITIVTGESPWLPGYQAAIDLYEQETGNSVVVRSFPPSDLKTQMVNDIQSGSHTFDVYQINEGDMVQFMSNKWVQPLTDIDPNFELDDEIFTYDDLPYWDGEAQVFDATGTLTSVPINGNILIYMYRKDLYEKLGLDLPKTWQDVIENGQAAMKSDEVPYGGAFRLQGATGGVTSISYDFQPIFNATGATWFKEEGVDWTPTVDSPEAIEAAKILRELALLGPEATTTMGQAQVIATMQAGDALQANLISGAAPGLEDEANSNVVGKMGYAPLPEGPDGGAATATGIWSLGVPAGLDEDRSEAALEFIKFVTSKDAQTAFAENGGIPIRGDYDTNDLNPAIAEALEATAASAPSATGQFRYIFTADMMVVTEAILSNIAAGAVEPEAGMRQMQQELTAVVQKYELPMG
jgi:multiple sugar transport system substrate-binding protein